MIIPLALSAGQNHKHGFNHAYKHGARRMGLVGGWLGEYERHAAPIPYAAPRPGSCRN